MTEQNDEITPRELTILGYLGFMQSVSDFQKVIAERSAKETDALKVAKDRKELIDRAEAIRDFHSMMIVASNLLSKMPKIDTEGRMELVDNLPHS